MHVVHAYAAAPPRTNTLHIHMRVHVHVHVHADALHISVTLPACVHLGDIRCRRVARARMHAGAYTRVYTYAYRCTHTRTGARIRTLHVHTCTCTCACTCVCACAYARSPHRACRPAAPCAARDSRSQVGSPSGGGEEGVSCAQLQATCVCSAVRGSFYCAHLGFEVAALVAAVRQHLLCLGTWQVGRSKYAVRA